MELFENTVHFDGGETVFEEGQGSDFVYVVEQGRCIAANNEQVFANFVKNQVFGEMGVLRKRPRFSSVRAVRDTIALEFPAEIFRAFLKSNLELQGQYFNLIANRALAGSASHSKTFGGEKECYIVTILPTMPSSKHFSSFAADVKKALQTTHGSCKMICEKDEVNLRQHLEMFENTYRYLLLVADEPTSGEWNDACLRNSDCIVIVNIDGKSTRRDVRRLDNIINVLGSSRKIIAVNGTTRIGLKTAPHSDFFREIKENFPSVQSKSLKFFSCINVRLGLQEDIARVARYITDTTVQVVLSGGACHGYMHLGAIEYLTRLGIPIDVIGGSSSGALVSALYAANGGTLDKSLIAYINTIRPSVAMTKDFAFLDLFSFPIVAIKNGRWETKKCKESFGELHFEDLFLNVFAVSTNLSTSEKCVHREGLLWPSVRASGNLPLLNAPCIVDGQVLTDGGVLDNLPTSVAKENGPGGYIIAINVSETLR
ncbi:unnamed protein product [Heterosigma akashiwo]